MKKDILMRTNIIVCLILIAGFSLTSTLSYRANYKTSMLDIEHISDLTSEGIYYQISDTFTKPVNVSLTMAHDSLLWEFLGDEKKRLDDAAYIETLREYLNTYRTEHGYDSVFLVSSDTQRYYNFNGMDRVLTRDNKENEWYYQLLESGQKYSINVDNDEVQGAQNHITVFVNCKIPDSAGNTLGIVGVGMRIDNLQELLYSYEEKFGVSAYLVNDAGTIEISTKHTGYERVDFFEQCVFASDIRNEILDWNTAGEARSLWTDNGGGDSYVVTRYIPELQWHLIVERNTGTMIAKMQRQLFYTVLIIIILIIGVLCIITCVIRKYNRRVVELTRAVERERHAVFEKTTKQLFEEIYEIDITHNCPANQVTAAYFESLGAPAGTPYDKSLHYVAEKQIKEEFRSGYLDTFMPEHVIRVFKAGQDSLQYDLMIASEGEPYYWVRIIARMVRWESDDSIHMLVYRQNIDAQRRQEIRMRELVQTDEMTALLTKTATRRRIEEALRNAPQACHAFFIFDIDHFKEANDLFGHAFGDHVICTFARSLQRNFQSGAIIGRLGGDEFGVFVPISGEEWAKGKAEELTGLLNQEYREEGKQWRITTSMGISLAPKNGKTFDSLYKKADEALYLVKKQGRDGYCFYGEE